MALATSLGDWRPSTRRATEARYVSLPAAVKEKLFGIEQHKNGLHAACESLRHRVLALRDDLAERQRQLRDAIERAAPARQWAFPSNDGTSGAVTIAGGPVDPVRQQEIDR